MATETFDYFKAPSTTTTEIPAKIFHEPEGFNIWRDSIQPFIKDVLVECLPEDDEELLHPDGGTHTKVNLARDLRDFLDYHRIRPAAEAHMLSLLEEYFPLTKLPVKKTKGGNYKSVLGSYTLPGFKVFEYDICINGCMAFVGIHKETTECPHCKKLRYRSCTHSDCLAGRVKVCNHKNRVAFKQVRYRSLMILLMYLLKQKGFPLALMYKHETLPGYQKCDIKDGHLYQYNMYDMHRR
jgi:hypothetical protein